MFLSVFCFRCVYSQWSPPSPRIPPSPAGAGGEIAWGPRQTIPGPPQPLQLPGRRAVCILWRQFKLLVQIAVVRGWPSSRFRWLCAVLSSPSPRSVERMPKPTADGEQELAATDEPSPHGATELRIAAESELLITSVKVHCFEGESRGWCERGEERRPLHRGWAEYSAWTVPQQESEGSWLPVKPRKSSSSRV